MTWFVKFFLSDSRDGFVLIYDGNKRCKTGMKVDGVVKSLIYCALVPGQTFDVLYVLLQAWSGTKS